MLAFLNGCFLPYSDLHIPPHDAGFVFGATVTDFCRTYAHRLFRWPDHLARLRRDCNVCAIPLPYSDADLTAAVEHLVRENTQPLAPDDDLALITFATPGPLGYMAGGSDTGPPTLAMHTFPLPKERYRRFFTEGVVLEQTGSLPAAAFPSPDLKHRSRIHWWVAGRQASAGHVAVLLSDQLAPDTAVGGVLAVRDGAIERPADGVLESVSVKVVAELAAKVGVEVRTREHWPEDPSADGISEMLLAGTAFGVAGVKAYLHPEGDVEFPWPGPVFTKLTAAWSELVGVDVVKQFTG